MGIDEQRQLVRSKHSLTRNGSKSRVLSMFFLLCDIASSRALTVSQGPEANNQERGSENVDK